MSPLPDGLDPDATDRLLALAVGAASLSGYLLCLCPTVGPGDSGELTVAALRLGIAHPPGYPLFTWLGRLATLVPVEPALAANVLTALVAAAAVTVLFLAARRLPLSRTASVTTSLGFGLGATFWAEATSHEVYGLSILLLSVTLLLALQGSPRHTLAAAFVFGLAVAHSPTALFWLPALLVLGARPGTRVRPVPAAAGSALAFALGLSSSLGTLLRAVARPEMNWGDPSTPARFWQHATAQQYLGLSLGATGDAAAPRLARLPALLAGDFGVPLLVLAVAGVIALAVTRRRILAGLLLLLATGLFGLRYGVPDFGPQLLPAFLALALLAGTGLDWLAARLAGPTRHRLRLALTIAGAAAAAVTPFVMNLGPGLEHRTSIVRDLGADLARSLPGNAALVFGADVIGNAVAYHSAVSDDSAGGLLVSAEMLFSATYWTGLGRRVALPAQGEVLSRAGTGTRSERLQFLLAAVLGRLLPLGPVFLSTDLLTPAFFAGPAARDYRVVPLGIVNQVMPHSEPVDRSEVAARNRELWGAYPLASLARGFREPAFQNIQLFYAASRNNLGMFCLEQGWTAEARAHLESALALPAPEWFRAVVRANRTRVP